MAATSGRTIDSADARPYERRSTLAATVAVRDLPVARIRPEEGLGRKRDRDGHGELCRSIQQFGVLTPITVRPARDGSGDYLLVKDQGRTLACRLLGLQTIPAVVLQDEVPASEKVQQFLVENVARLRMRPVDRALLISRARLEGEETASVARRFGVSAATVRRLENQLEGASKGEVAALIRGDLNLALHAVIARHVDLNERGAVVAEVAKYKLRARELEELLQAIGWAALRELGPKYRTERLMLLAWTCHELSRVEPGSMRERLQRLAERLPSALHHYGAATVSVSSQ